MIFQDIIAVPMILFTPILAGAEGNAAALRVLAENGASLALKDRWDHTAMYEAKKSKGLAFAKEFSKLTP